MGLVRQSVRASEREPAAGLSGDGDGPHDSNRGCGPTVKGTEHRHKTSPPVMEEAFFMDSVRTAPEKKDLPIWNPPLTVM